ncbi:MAG: hypothetical protein ACRDRJ_02185 [Streptosporangiaceae bacterium]
MAEEHNDPQSPDDAAGSEQPDSDGRADGSWPADSILASFGAQYAHLVTDLQSSIARNLTVGFTPPNISNWFPQITMPDFLQHLPMPTLGIDPAALNTAKYFGDIIQAQQISITAPFAELLEQQHKQWGSLFESLHRLAERFFPPNWQGVEHPDFDTIEVILVDEGIPLAWIPCPETLQALLDASDARGRRKIIGRRWKGIVSDCEEVLDEVSHPALQCHHPFAMDTVTALRDGHVSAAQALAANLLDSILRRNFDKHDFKDVTTNKKNGNRFDLDAYQARAAFTLAPVWRAYAEYWQSQGDPIPRTFGRHPSAHAVSRMQYSRVNAVVAVMLVTSLLCLLDAELVH